MILEIVTRYNFFLSCVVYFFPQRQETDEPTCSHRMADTLVIKYLY